MTHPVCFTLGGKVHMTVVYLIELTNMNDLLRMHLFLKSISTLELLFWWLLLFC